MPKPYTSGYLDSEPTPLFPFGHGLTYTNFVFGPPQLDRTRMGAGDTVTVSVDVMNTGARPGTALVQLYIRHKLARISRPVRELRGFARLALGPKDAGTVHMTLAEKDLAFWQPDGRFAPPGSGAIEVMTGPSSGELRGASFDYLPTPRQATSRP